MRRRLVLITLAVTVSITIAFLVPLAIVVRTVARDRALSEGEQAARSLAGVLAAVGDAGNAGDVVTQFNATAATPATIVRPDGTTLGAGVAVPDDELRLARSGRAFTTAAGGGRRIIVPVRVGDGVHVVAVLVPAAELTKGVALSWATLASVGVVLVLFGVVLADRLARSTVLSIADLGRVTERLQAGDLDARVAPSGPPEVVQAGQTLNELAATIEGLLASERESLADLSHRVRTPLTALELEIDNLRSPAVRERLGPAVASVTDALTDFISEARTPRRGPAVAGADLARIVRHRAEYWKVLAGNQRRAFSCDVPDQRIPVAASEEDVTAAVDAVVGNVFQHTPPGAAVSVLVGADAGGGVLQVDDDGPGFTAEPARGRSGAGSTGLGLDIARRTAVESGGSLAVSRSDRGGARVTVRFGGAGQGRGSS